MSRVRLIVACAMACMLGNAFGQSFSSFQQTDGIYGVSVTPSALSYTVAMDPGAYLVLNGNHYDITNIFGFWALRSDADLSATGVDQIQWNWNANNAGPGGIAGFHNPSKSNDIEAGQQLTFTFTTLDQAHVDGYGFHMTVAQGLPGGGNTAFFTGPLNPVPEPASLAVVGAGVAAFLRRRRKA